MHSAATRSRAKKVTIDPAATKEASGEQSNAIDPIATQVKRLLEVTETAAAARAAQSSAEMDKRCSQVEESHRAAMGTMQEQLEQLRREVKRLGDNGMATVDYRSTHAADSAAMQKVQKQLDTLSAQEAAAHSARAAMEERVFRMQNTVAGLTVATEASRRVVARVDQLEHRVAAIERRMKRECLRNEEKSSKPPSAISVEVEQRQARPQGVPSRGILKGWGSLRVADMIDQLSDVQTVQSSRPAVVCG